MHNPLLPPEPMLRVGLWNTRGKPVSHLLAAMARERDLNVLVLLENRNSDQALLAALNSGADGLWYLTWGACPRITILTRFSDEFVKPRIESETHSLRTVKLPGLPEIVIAVAHLRSRAWQAERSQSFGAVELVDAIVELEEQVGHRRTLLVGDFNMDPFDDGMVGARALHAMMTRKTAAKGSRVVENRPYPMFYNPMWSLLGDTSPGPPGTYRYWRSEYVCQEWHAFDQVLVRPDLIDAFPTARLQILDRIGETALLTAAGVPSPSDHLPLTFHLLEPWSAP